MTPRTELPKSRTGVPQHTPRANGHARGVGRDFTSVAIFAKNFFVHPRMLGSIVPSSRFLIRRLLNRVDWEKTRVFVEFGPGVGNITSEILSRISPEGRVIAIDTNKDFIHHLSEKLHDPRFSAVHGSAEHVREILQQHGIAYADHVVAGIPFSVMPEDLRNRVVAATRKVLRPGGSLLIYQFSPAVRASLEPVFDDVRHEFEWLNILPAHVFRCHVAHGHGTNGHGKGNGTHH